jgi:hypothetical protein
VRFWALAVIYLCVSHFAFANQVLEEVLAVVDSTPILHSDIELAGLVSLVERGPDTTIDAYRSRLLDARIRLELQYRDLEESGTLYRLDIDLERALDTLIARAGNEQALRDQFEKHGLAWADLEELALRIAVTSAFTEQRLRPRVSVSLEEVRTAYQELIVAQYESHDQTVPPLTSVHDDLHRLLLERKLNEEIERWLDSVADRHDVTRFVR